MASNRFLTFAAALAGAAGFLSGAAAADEIADFYKGKQMSAISGGGAGGGFSLAARILGISIVNHIPGKPEWVVTAMPGAGGSRSVKYIVNAAAQDGTVVGVVLPPAILSPLLRKNVGYDSAKLRWIGSITPMPTVCSVWHTSPVQSVEQAKTKELVTGTSSKLSNGYLVPSFVNAVKGTKIKIISGYRGGDRQNNAMEKGELQGRCSFFASYETTKPHWLREKLIRHIFYTGPRLAELKDVPHLEDMARNDAERDMVTFLSIGDSVGHGFFVSPGVPMARVKALRAAFDATVKDPAFLAEAKKRRQRVSPISGEALDAVVAKAMGTPKATVAAFRKLVKLDEKSGKGKKAKK
jgi:tripartite-type tricarboxylate transporter receptor subunit TctC